MDDKFRDQWDELRGMVLAQQVRIAELERQNEQLQALHGSDTQQLAAPAGDGPRRMSRAGMLKAVTTGAAATLGTAGLMQAKAPLVAAADSDPVTAGRTVTAESATSINYDGTTNPGLVLLVQDSGAFSAGEAAYPAAIGGWATGTNVSNGVYGYSDVSNGYGVVGFADSGASHGVVGKTTNVGKAGVYGSAQGGSSYGVFGTANGSSGAFAGVFNGNVSVTNGYTTSHNPTGHGVLGTSDATHYGGLSGATTISGGAGLIGSNSNVAGAYGGLIYGPLVVTGTKSAAVMHPDGTRRLVYCVEAPESYLEDVGEAHLVNGKATVHLRKDFAARIDAGHYYVFLTPLGSARASLALAERHGDHFVVVGNDHTTAFHYRIMAKRGDVKAERLAPFDVPEPDIAAAMHNPEIPKVPAIP